MELLLFNKKAKLFRPAKEGNLEVVQKLLNKGADVNWKGEDGRTALYLASGKAIQNCSASAG